MMYGRYIQTYQMFEARWGEDATLGGFAICSVLRMGIFCHFTTVVNVAAPTTRGVLVI